MADERPVYRQELTPLTFLERSAAVHADRLAVEDGEVRLTYREWRDRVHRFASALRHAGIGNGDRVAFLAFNSEPLLLAHFAVPLAGAVLVAINTRLSPDDVTYIVGHSGARLLVVEPQLEGLLAGVPDSVRRLTLGSDFEAFGASGSLLDELSGPDSEDQVLAIDYTSGTTGRPKGVMYHHRGAALNAVAMTLELNLRPGSRYLWTLPMFHCNGWCFTWAAVAAGACSVCLPKVDPEEIWGLLRRGEVDGFCAAPTVLIMLVNAPQAAPVDRPVRVMTAGAPPSPTLIAQMQELGFDLVHVYGLTETYGPVTVAVPPPDAGRLSEVERADLTARQGLPHLLGGEVRVVDQAMDDVARDGEALGEVVTRGNITMKGYFANPEATAEAFSGGWFHTGDVGVWHPDGSIDLRDRKKDVIISGGENISTIEIERAIASHPAVLECAVVAVPDERWGEVPKAFVTLKPGEQATERQIIDHCRSRLAHFKCPSSVAIGDLPKTATGKIQKFVLREREWRGRDRRIN
ncbi:MAG: acyl--CoA ligase family protein [Candidatus Dormibacteraceae bacterium]